MASTPGWNKQLGKALETVSLTQKNRNLQVGTAVFGCSLLMQFHYFSVVTCRRNVCMLQAGAVVSCECLECCIMIKALLVWKAAWQMAFHLHIFHALRMKGRESISGRLSKSACYLSAFCILVSCTLHFYWWHRAALASKWQKWQRCKCPGLNFTAFSCILSLSIC